MRNSDTIVKILQEITKTSYYFVMS